MIRDLPDTTSQDVSKALVSIREECGVSMMGRVLTLIVIADDIRQYEPYIQAAKTASREHPCRVLVVIRGNAGATNRMDAQIRFGGDTGASETIILRLYGELSNHGASVVTPLLLPDNPVVAWWPRNAPRVPSQDPIGRLAIRRITDADAQGHPTDVLPRRRQGHHSGDTDLAWSRITHWRAMLVSLMQQPPCEPILRATVSGPENSSSVDLGGAWIAAKTGIEVNRATGAPMVVLHRATSSLMIRQIDRHTAEITVGNQPPTSVALSIRKTADCLAEELRRLDPDPVYDETLDHLNRLVALGASHR